MSDLAVITVGVDHFGQDKEYYATSVIQLDAIIAAEPEFKGMNPVNLIQMKPFPFTLRVKYLKTPGSAFVPTQVIPE